MKINEGKIRSYIDRCFIDAFKSENREYSRSDYTVEFVVINYKHRGYQIYPIITCKYKRVLGKVTYRLSKNFYKNFGIQYLDLEDSHACIDEGNQIDPNFTRFMLQAKKTGKIYRLNYYSDFCSKREGETMISWIVEKLLLAYWNITIDELKRVRSELNLDFKEWSEYEECFLKATGVEPSDGFYIFTSSGLYLL